MGLGENMAKSAAERVRDHEERLRAVGGGSFRFLMSPELRQLIDEHRGELSAAVFLRDCLGKHCAWLDDRDIQQQMSLLDYLNFSDSIDKFLPAPLKKQVDDARGETPFTEYVVNVLHEYHNPKKERKRRGRPVTKRTA